MCDAIFSYKTFVRLYGLHLDGQVMRCRRMHQLVFER